MRQESLLCAVCGSSIHVKATVIQRHCIGADSTFPCPSSGTVWQSATRKLAA